MPCGFSLSIRGQSLQGSGYLARVVALAAAVAGSFAVSCTVTLDAGSTRSRGLLPVDERNPIVVLNDGAYDNWQTEYAVLLANAGGPELVGILIGTSGPWPDLDVNVTGARDLVAAARASGLVNLPDPIATIGEVLARPASGDIEDTQPNRSEGALFIIEASRRYALSYRPLVIASGGRLTDVADAYLIDPTVAERVVVVASLGSLSSTGAVMGEPNGEMDPWADTIVTSRFRYVQVSAFYDQLQEVPATRLAELPENAFGGWIAAKQANIFTIPEAADQVAVAAVGIPDFVTEVVRVAPVESASSDAVDGPVLEMDPEGPGWLVRGVEGAVAVERFWSILSDRTTFVP